MSEIERAIETLEDFNQAITALQEKLEREKGCECCDLSAAGAGKTMSYAGDRFVIVGDKNGARICTDEKHFYTLNIKFCPKCGKQLKGCAD